MDAMIAPVAAIVTGGLGFALAWRIQTLRQERALQRHQRGVESLKVRLDEALEEARLRAVALEARERGAASLQAEAEAKVEELKAQSRAAAERLASLAGLSADEARRQLREEILGEVREAANSEADRIRENARSEAEGQARRVLARAIDRVAIDVTKTHAARHVKLGSTWLKSRLMGQDGSNLQAFEKATGVQLVVDEAADAVTISAFDPIRRELARRVLGELASGGSLHPARITDVVARLGGRIAEEMQRCTQQTLEATGLEDLTPELAEMLGRLRFCEAGGQDLLSHSVEVALLAREIALEMGEDPVLACRAGLLHDIGVAADGDVRADHAERGAVLAAKHGESPAVCEAIARHEETGDGLPALAALVAVANRISASRPGARADETLEPPHRVASVEKSVEEVDGIEEARAVLVGDALALLARVKESDDGRADVLTAEIVRRAKAGSSASRVQVSLVPQPALGAGHARA